MLAFPTNVARDAGREIVAKAFKLPVSAKLGHLERPRGI